MQMYYPQKETLRLQFSVVAHLGLHEELVALLDLPHQLLLLPAQLVPKGEVSVQVEDLQLLAQDTLLHADPAKMVRDQ